MVRITKHESPNVDISTGTFSAELAGIKSAVEATVYVLGDTIAVGTVDVAIESSPDGTNYSDNMSIGGTGYSGDFVKRFDIPAGIQESIQVTVTRQASATGNVSVIILARMRD